MERLIFHVDVNSAFLSWEAVYRLRYLHEELDIRTVPAAIGGDREARCGIILASSIPAKKLGVRTPEPIVDALRKCPNLMLFPPRSDFYHECSHAFMNILREYTDMVQPFSSDEAGVDLSGCEQARRDPVAFADMLRNRIHNELGFTVNIGISTNLLLSKMASDFTKPDKTHTLWPSEIPSKMWPLPVKDLMYIGSATGKRLNDLGIRTIGQLAAMDPVMLSPYFGKGATGMVEFANGIDNRPVTLEHEDLKGYGNSTTLPQNILDRDEACRVLLMLCESVGTRMRRDNARVKVISVAIRDGNFDKISHQLTMETATSITNELYSYACRLFDQIWDGRPIRALGVHTSGISGEEDRQLSLFDHNDYSRQEQVDKAMDALRARFGRDKIVRASLIEPPPARDPETGQRINASQIHRSNKPSDGSETGHIQ